MLTNESKTSTSASVVDISLFQRIFFYILLFFIPWLVLPLPWDPTDQVKITFFIVFSSIILLLEFIKWIWDGKVVIFKSSLDKVSLLLLLSFLISTIFALDKWTAIWGFDGRLGTGFLSISILLAFFFLSRSFLNSSKYIVKSSVILSLGISTLLILSLLSFLKINIFGWMPVFKNFFVTGLPLTFYSDEIVLLSAVLILLSIYLLLYYLKEKRYQSTILPFISIFLGFISIPLFSIKQGILLPVLLFVGFLFLIIFLFVKLEKKLKFIPSILSLLVILAMVFTIGLQYDSFKNSLLGKSFDVVSPIHLASDLSWSVASKTVVENFGRGLVGVGNESFSVAYNLFRPATPSTISLSNVNFNSSSNEFFTTLATRGILGVVIWILIGLVLIRVFIEDLTSQKGKEGLLLSILEISTIIFYLSVFFVSFSFLLYFIFFVLLLLSLMSRNIVKGSDEQFLLKFWAVHVGRASQNVSKTINSVNWFLTILFILLCSVSMFSLGSKLLSAMYIARAEAYSIEEMKKYTEESEVTMEVREKFFDRLVSYYLTALRYDSSSPVANRKASGTVVEIMNVLSELYQKSSEEEKASVLSEITNWKNSAIDLSREAVTTAPFIYSNWYARANVYMGLLSIGLSDYSEDALFALQRATSLNPLDFESYYRAGQIYMIKQDYEKALAAFNAGLTINGQHVPSLVLSASILKESGETKTAISYLEAAKKIMEVNKLQEDPMYKSILDSIEEFGGSASSDGDILKENDGDFSLEDFEPAD
ncbi:MAG: hypothetical protein ACOX0X_01535 [Candidatus Dojkabacteria bacterium]